MSRPLPVDGPALVITYDSPHEAARRGRLQRELDAAGIGYEFIDPGFEPGSRSQYDAAEALGMRFTKGRTGAVDLAEGVNVDPSYKARRDHLAGDIVVPPLSLRSILDYHRGMIADGAIGCTLSHALALHRAAGKETGCNTLILESDAHLTEGFVRAASDAIESVSGLSGWDVLLLAYKELGRVVPAEHEGSVCKAGYCWCTLGYVVSPAGAAAILAAMTGAAKLPVIDDIIPAMAWGSPVTEIDEEFGPLRVASRRAGMEGGNPLIVYRTRRPLLVEHELHGRVSGTSSNVDK